jgi:hydroxypyruvate isomerase
MSKSFPQFCAGLGHLFNEWDLLDRFALAGVHGFDGVELTSPYVKTPAQLQKAREAAGLEVIIFTAPLGDFLQGGEGIAAVPGRSQEFMESVEIALEYAEALDANLVQFVSGRCFGQDHDLAKRARYFNTFVENVDRAAEVFARHKTNVVLEAINTRDYPDYLLNIPEHLFAVVEAATRDDIKIEFDTLHHRAMGLDCCDEIRKNGGLYSHLQLSDYPDRSPPGTGELDFPAIYRAILNSDYRGWIGTEYHPAKTGSLDSLTWLAQARQILAS